MASAYPLQTDLRPQAASIERKVKTLINETLKQICRAESLQVSGLKAHLQQRIINKVDQLVARGDAEGLDRIEHAVKNNGHMGSWAPHATNPLFNGGSPPAISGSGRMANGYGTAVNGSSIPASSIPQSKIQWKDTPFFSILETLTPTLDLPKLEGHKQLMHMRLTIPHRLFEPLRTNSKLRIMLYSAGEPIMGQGLTKHDVSFPQQMEVKVNSKEEVKWNHKGLKNKPGSAQPGDLTAFLRKVPDFTNDISIMYALTSKRFFMNILLVKRSTPEELTKELKARAVISKTRVIAEMRAKAADPDIEATSTNMSLKDPISMLRMTVPIRSDVCTHNQCFDAFTFLDMQQQGPTWTCPICSKPVQYRSLHIDEYVQDILQRAPTLDQVTLDPDGTWRAVVEKPETQNGASRHDYDDDSDDLVEISDYRPNGLKAEPPTTPFSFGTTPYQASPAPGVGSRVNGSGGVGSKRKSEVIDLTLSDEEDAPPARRPNFGTSSSSPSFFKQLYNGLDSSKSTPNLMAPGISSFTLPNHTSSHPSASSFSFPQPPPPESFPRPATSFYQGHQSSHEYPR